jgi:hypothetical protein
MIQSRPGLWSETERQDQGIMSLSPSTPSFFSDLASPGAMSCVPQKKKKSLQYNQSRRCSNPQKQLSVPVPFVQGPRFGNSRVWVVETWKGYGQLRPQHYSHMYFRSFIRYEAAGGPDGIMNVGTGKCDCHARADKFGGGKQRMGRWSSSGRRRDVEYR